MMKKNNQNSGIALLFTLILVVTFFVLGMAFMSRANFSAKIAKNYQEAESARLASNLALSSIKTSMEEAFSVNQNLTGEDKNYGYTLPVWEMKVLVPDSVGGKPLPGKATKGVRFDNDVDETIDGVTLKGGFAFQRFAFDTGADVKDQYERGIRSLNGANKEVAPSSASDTYNYVQPYYNRYGLLVRASKWSRYSLVVDPSWDASSGQRHGSRYAYFLLDKTGNLDVNAVTKHDGSSDPTEKGVKFSDLNKEEVYADYDLSLIWPASNFNRTVDEPVLNYDDLYGVDIGGYGGIGKSRPASLEGAYAQGNTSAWSDFWVYESRLDPGDNVYSYTHITTPYSVGETVPAYDVLNEHYQYTDINDNTYDLPALNSVDGTTKARFDLASLKTGSTNNQAQVDTILTGIPYLNNWGDNSLTGTGLTATEISDLTRQKNQVAANINDYIDDDLKSTTNYVSPTIDASTYCGNERTPLLNELTFNVRTEDGTEPIFYITAELAWLYGADLPTELQKGSQDFEVRVIGKVTGQFVEDGVDKASFNETYDFTLKADTGAYNSPEVADSLEAKNFFEDNAYVVTQTAQGRFDTMAIENTETTHGFATIASATPMEDVKDVVFTVTALELRVGGELVDIAQLPETLPAFPNGGINFAGAKLTRYTSIQCNDPRVNTFSSSWKQAPRWGKGSWVGVTLSKFHPRGNEGSMGMANHRVNNSIPIYPATDSEKNAWYGYVDWDGVDRAYKTNSFREPVSASTRYMPANGGITHEVELGSISRGIPWQTLNLVEYNLDEAKERPRAKYSRSREDEYTKHNDAQRTSASASNVFEPESFYDHLAFYKASGNKADKLHDGGDRQILDDVYIAGSTLQDLTKLRKVYGKLNANTLRMGALKGMMMSMTVPEDSIVPRGLNAKDGEVATSGVVIAPDEETRLSPDYPTSTVIFFGSDDLKTINPWWENNKKSLRFMTKYTYDKLAPLSAKNAPNDPMRWGSKRLGALFSGQQISLAYDPGQVHATLNDRQRETLLLKMKNLMTVRYTHYSGVVISESVLLKPDTGTKPKDFVKMADAVVSETVNGVSYPITGTYNHKVRPALMGKILSTHKYRIELAYDHFLDKVVVLDYKRMGKYQRP